MILCSLAAADAIPVCGCLWQILNAVAEAGGGSGREQLETGAMVITDTAVAGMAVVFLCWWSVSVGTLVLE